MQGKYDYIEQNLIKLRKKISLICNECSRDATEIYIVAVSKTFSTNIIAAAMDFNQLDFGENKVQELISKQKEFEDRIIHWHLIGHLQTNKVKYIVPFIFMIHSVDSFKLAQKINSEASKIKRKVNCLVQVNTTGEEQKSGCKPNNTIKLVKEMAQLEYIKIKGLMTIAKIMSDQKDEVQRKVVRGNFKLLKNLFDEISTLKAENIDMTYLSMGMTDDFDIAIQEGSNMIRVGSAIFGQRIS